MLLFGSLPVYRTLKAGESGADVRQLEENLAALGRSGFTVDDQYTDATATAEPAAGAQVDAELLRLKIDELSARTGVK